MVRWRVTRNDDDPAESPKLPQEDTSAYIWRYVDPADRAEDDRKGMTFEAWLIGVVLIAVWVNAGVIVWRDLLG